MTRAAYHHGNLRSEVLDAAYQQVSRGGMGALVAREIARDVGVTPAAVYRHFDDVEHLKAAVSQRGREELAQAMIDARDAVPRRRNRVRRAIERFRATGSAYVQFSIDQPGLFDAAFAACDVDPSDVDDPSAWDVLNECLDDLVDVGALSPRLRDEAPLIAWTSMHGLASLVSLNGLPPELPLPVLLEAVTLGVHRALELPDEW